VPDFESLLENLSTLSNYSSSEVFDSKIPPYQGERMIGLPESKDKRVFNNLLGAIGNTPLVKLERIGRDLPVV